MAKNIFNSVKGLHPRRNAFSALTYRNDFTAPLGVNIPCYVQHVPPATRIKCSCSALVRLQALFAPIMDNIDFYVHFWQMPYRLIVGDLFTQFISGEINPEEYDEFFCTPDEASIALINAINQTSLIPSNKKKEAYDAIVGNGGLIDFLGYDSKLFSKVSLVNSELVITETVNNTTKFNLRPLVMYYKLLANWYMNENVDYWSTQDLFDEGSFMLACKTYLDYPATLGYTSSFLVAFYIEFNHTLVPHAWEKDYFTSALPNVQFGTPVTIPIAGNAPVSLSEEVDHFVMEGKGELIDETGIRVTQPIYAESLAINGNGLQSNVGSPVKGLIGHNSSMYDAQLYAKDENNDIVHSPYVADLSEASAITINELRFANALQVFKERQLRYGRRRQEYYKGFFDVTPEDLRLMLPKYLGGGRIPINISDIEQTSQSTKGESGSPQGNLSGKATAVAGGFAGFNTFCSEESLIMGICFAIPHITYAQNISKFLLKTNDVYDYFNPSFEHLGEQPILNIELYSGSGNPEGEFGYTPRYTEYRFHNNECHGAFKDTLSYWTLARIFSSTPALNKDFIYMQPSVFNRIFAVYDSEPMLVSMLFRVRAIMPVSKYGTPMLLS